jgi:hypothetical protein
MNFGANLRRKMSISLTSSHKFLSAETGFAMKKTAAIATKTNILPNIGSIFDVNMAVKLNGN